MYQAPCLRGIGVQRSRYKLPEVFVRWTLLLPEAFADTICGVSPVQRIMRLTNEPFDSLLLVICTCSKQTATCLTMLPREDADCKLRYVNSSWTVVSRDSLSVCALPQQDACVGRILSVIYDVARRTALRDVYRGMTP